MWNEDRVDLFSKPAHPVPETKSGAPGSANDRPPRGLTPAGWVRTTGWLQFGDHPVSSVHLATAVGLLWALVCAAALIGTSPVVAGVLVVVAPALCGASWWIFITRVRPASAARNIGMKRVDELLPGDLVRLFGQIGPIGRVAAVTFGDEVRVALDGGEYPLWSRHDLVHVAELLN